MSQMEVPKSRKNKTRIKCSLCGEPFITNTRLKFHLRDIHNEEISEENIVFPSNEGFLIWKEHIESETSSSYVAQTGIKKLSGNRKRRYFHCHRSSEYTPGGTGQRCLKFKGTVKINSACPSRMEVTYYEKKVEVVFRKQHIGHAVDITKLRLPRSAKEEIADKLRQGLSMDCILQQIWDSPKSIREGITERQDVRNIIRDYNIEYNTKVREDGRKGVCLKKRDIVESATPDLGDANSGNLESIEMHGTESKFFTELEQKVDVLIDIGRSKVMSESQQSNILHKLDLAIAEANEEKKGKL